MQEDQVKSKMQTVLDLVVNDIGSIRTGRATPALVTDIFIPVYAGQQKLKIQEIGTTTVSDPQTIIIEPWDKSIIGEIRQGLQAANIGLNPVIDGELIRIAFPPLTSEDRAKYVKLLSQKIENGKVMIRQIRADAMKKIKDTFEKKEISEDMKFGQEKKLQEITDSFVKKIEEAGQKKEKEILNI